MISCAPTSNDQKYFFCNWQWDETLSLDLITFFRINIAQYTKRYTSIRENTVHYFLSKVLFHLHFINSLNNVSDECEVTPNQNLANIWFISFSKRKQWPIQSLSMWFSTNFNVSSVVTFQMRKLLGWGLVDPKMVHRFQFNVVYCIKLISLTGSVVVPSTCFPLWRASATLKSCIFWLCFLWSFSKSEIAFMQFSAYLLPK